MTAKIDTRIIVGRVIRGEGRGKQLGFPTANMSPIGQEELPEHGVYAAKVIVRGKTYSSLANIGFAKTFDATIATIEPYIFDFNLDIYGEIIVLILCHQLREMIKFPCPAMLVKQLKFDCLEIRRYFALREFDWVI